jgi:phage tail sheath protein FI
MHPYHPRYWRTAVNSQYILLEEPASPPSTIPEDLRPRDGTFPLIGSAADDRGTAWTEIVTAPADYLNLLREIDEVNMVAIPGATNLDAQQAIVEHCETMRDRFGILDSIPGALPGSDISDQLAGVRGDDLGFAALYYPWIQTRDPVTKQVVLTPPSGHIAGIYARTDARRGVHKAPANTNIRGALGLEMRLTDAQQGPLNLMGINVLRVFPGRTQPVVWGARTTAGKTTWQYVNVRRLMLYIEESIEEGIRWAVFEPNNLQLWQKLRRTITEFLTRVWRDGALFGATAEEAFYVRIDEILNPPSERALGRLYIEIGVAPSYPAEFIIVRIGLWDGGSEVSES